MNGITGFAIAPDGLKIDISPHAEYHELDGYKLKTVFVACYMESVEEIEEFITFLQIAREGLRDAQKPVKITRRWELLQDLPIEKKGTVIIEKDGDYVREEDGVSFPYAPIINRKWFAELKTPIT